MQCSTQRLPFTCAFLSPIFPTHFYGYCGNSNDRRMKTWGEKEQSVVFQRQNLTSAPHWTGCESRRMIAQLLFPLIVFPFQHVKNPCFHNDAMNSSQTQGCVKASDGSKTVILNVKRPCQR